MTFCKMVAKRCFFGWVLGSLVIPLMYSPGLVSGEEKQKEKYPQKPIMTVGPYTEGGGSDTVGRILSSVMHQYIGVPFVHINKPGAGGTIAGSYIAHSKPDGYSVGVFGASSAVPENIRYFYKSDYTSKDLKPVCRVSYFPYAVAVRSGAPFETLKDLIEAAKKKPKELSFAHYGRGHPYFLFLDTFFSKVGAELVDVPFKGSSEAYAAIMAKQIDIGIGSLTSLSSFYRAGKLKLLAVVAEEPWEGVPTFKELGYDLGFPDHFVDLFVAAGTPDERVQILREALKKAITESKSFRTLMKNALLPYGYGGPEVVEEDMRKVKEVLGAALKKQGFWPKEK